MRVLTANSEFAVVRFMEGNVSGLRDALGRFGDGFVVLIWLSFDEAPLPDGRPAGGRAGMGTVLLYPVSCFNI